MALSDCPKCWDTPCICGHMYEQMPVETVRKIHEATGRVLADRAEPSGPNPTGKH